MHSKPESLETLKSTMKKHVRADESVLVKQLYNTYPLSQKENAKIRKTAAHIVTQFRESAKLDPIDQIFQYHGLETKEGIALLNIAEALIRIPDKTTAIDLIRDKLSTIEWQKKPEERSTLSTLIGKGIALTNKTLKQTSDGIFSKLLRSISDPIILKTTLKSMHFFNKKFVLAESVDQALKQSKKLHLSSFDMLGESARTYKQADHYFKSYKQAIESIGQTAHKTPKSPHANHGISVKLTALHPRFEWKKHEEVLETLLPKIKELCLLCAQYNLPLTLDAEESRRFDLFCTFLEALIQDPDLRNWHGLGIALQAYRKQAYAALDWLIALAETHNKKLAIRLVKGAYWDTEIKYDQQMGLTDYTVFTRKVNTDISYLACAFKMLANRTVIYSQFATHNAFTIAAILEKTSPDTGFEFQRLYGMGEELYNAALKGFSIPCRVYAPIGLYADLLPYLVRRFLENGANSSFINQLTDFNTSSENLIEDPMKTLTTFQSVRNNKIPEASELYPDRKNALGMDFDFEDEVSNILANIGASIHPPYHISHKKHTPEHTVYNPANHDDLIGSWDAITEEEIDAAFTAASLAQPSWDAKGGAVRAAVLQKAASLLEASPYPFLDLIIREGGRTIADAISEIREAIDFCRYYANLTNEHFAHPKMLPGPTGETNALSLHGKGVFVCISPWNFPLAIFMGQITAALAAGNAVIAKPAKQTPLIASQAIKLLHDAGVPKDILSLILGPGSSIGDFLSMHKLTAGVVFTGSTAVAQHINQNLAQKPGAITPLIAETGGQNAMIVDSTALPEQTVDAIIESAFMSAGQRCSSLRVLFIDEEIADTIIDMLLDAVDTLTLGDPTQLSTDIGPIIDQHALSGLHDHVAYMKNNGTLLKALEVPQELKGTFFAPHIYEIDHLQKLREEVFGPILHIIRYKNTALNQVLEQIKQTKFGLTLGIQTRIMSKAHDIFNKLEVGNTYVNRNMIGAVVGSQPFGGHGLSGTGPKAGGPHYLFRFANEKVLTINTTATGGNPELINLKEE